MTSNQTSAEADRRVRASGIAALLLLAIPACAPTEFHHPVYPAGGTVSYQGKPVEDAVVVFHPEDPATIALPRGEQGPEIANPTTRTDADGAFALSTYYTHDGAPAGDYRVTVIWAPQALAAQPGPPPEGDEEVAPTRVYTRPKDKLLGKYADPKTSTLRASITPDGPNRFTFALE
jgi:hypothetical protein